MNCINNLIPMLTLGGAAGVGLAVFHALLPLLRRAPFTQAALEVVMAVCETAVRAIEQAHGDLAGVDKKQLATQMIGDILARLNVHPPQALVDAGVEAAVLALNQISGKISGKAAA